MSLGFGFGLPHHVAILGGGPPPPATVYFLSLTTSTACPVGTLYSYSTVIDGSGNIIAFCRDTALGGEVIQLTSSGAFSTAKYFTTSSSAYGIPDGSGGYYISIDSVLGCCCCGYYAYPSVLKLDSSFNILSKVRTNNSGPSTAGMPVIDSSGNIFTVLNDLTIGISGAGELLRVNSALNSSNYLWYGPTYAIIRTIKGAAITTTNQLVYTGSYLVAGICCVYAAYATVTSVSAATPTATPTWQVWDSSSTVGDFDVLALDSSNNVYAGMYIYAASDNNTLVKISSAGAVQWQYRYVGMTHISDIATDSSGNVYCVSVSVTGALVIIKVNSSGVLQYSRTLTPATSVISGYQQITINGSIMYITTSWANKLLVFKVPTDGSLTQSISVDGFSFTYAAGSVTSVATTIALAATTIPPALDSTAETLTTTPITTVAVTPTTAVAVL